MSHAYRSTANINLGRSHSSFARLLGNNRKSINFEEIYVFNAETGFRIALGIALEGAVVNHSGFNAAFAWLTRASGRMSNSNAFFSFISRTAAAPSLY